MKVHYYRHDRGRDIKGLPKARAGNDAHNVFTISVTWLAWSWIWRFPDTAVAMGGRR